MKPSDSSGTSSPLCRDTNQCFLPRQFIPSISFLPSPCLSLSISQSISHVFVFLSFGRFSLNTIGFSLSRFPSRFLPFFLFSSPFFPPGLGGIYRGRGSARPIATLAWCARCLLFPGTDNGGQWRRRLRGTAALASHHEMGGV